METTAANLLAELGITDIPIPVDEVLARLGVLVVLEQMGNDISGMTYRSGEGTIVGLNQLHSAKRRRFTAAHEIGHVVLHPGRPLTVDSSIRVNFRDEVSSQATDIEEIQANGFAAALLMPPAAVLENVRQLTDSGIKSRERLIATLAKRFDVSPEAMGYRLINLGIASAP